LIDLARWSYEEFRSKKSSAPGQNCARRAVRRLGIRADERIVADYWRRNLIEDGEYRCRKRGQVSALTRVMQDEHKFYDCCGNKRAIHVANRLGDKFHRVPAQRHSRHVRRYAAS